VPLPPLIEIEALSKRFGPISALADCSLGVAAGEVIGFLGPNGAGKTTLLRLLLGFLRPTSGKATLAGFDSVKQSLEVRRRVAYLPGEAKLFRRMRGHDVHEFFAHLRPNGTVKRANELAQRLDLDLSRRVATMSTGMRQKLALAVTFMPDTPILILDEPTANLDPSVRREVLALVSEARSAGRTVLFSSHVFAEVEEVCDRVAILRQGRLVHLQPIADILRQHRIRAELTSALPQIPAELASRVTVRHDGNGEITFDTPGELSPLLGWLATLPLTEVRVEPIGLRAVYERFHGGAVE
jgi:ABC-2 type transport system ATP-binding protein